MKIFGFVWCIGVYRGTPRKPDQEDPEEYPVENLPGNIWPIDGPKSLNVFLDNHQMSLPSVCARQARLRRGVLPSGGTGGRLPAETLLEIAQSEQDVSPFCKESDMTYS